MKNFNKDTKITLAGVSQNPEKYGHKIFKDLLKNNYDVVGINPKGGIILDQKIYSSLNDIERESQLLIIVLPPLIGIDVVKNAHEIGINNIWLQPGAQNNKIVEYAKLNGINLIYNQCFMVDQGIW